MGTSVRAIVEPYDTALSGVLSGHGNGVIFLQGSFVGLPLINQALAAENPLGGGRFFVTVKALLKVLGDIPASDVIHAVTDRTAPPVKPPPARPPNPQIPVPGSPSVVTCNVERDLGNPGTGSTTNFRFFGGGFSFNETVDIIEVVDDITESPFATTNADASGGYEKTVSVINSPADGPLRTYTVYAHGESNGLNTRKIRFTN